MHPEHPDFSASPSGRKFVFGTAEYRVLSEENRGGLNSAAEVPDAVSVVAPSRGQRSLRALRPVAGADSCRARTASIPRHASDEEDRVAVRKARACSTMSSSSRWVR